MTFVSEADEVPPLPLHIIVDTSVVLSVERTSPSKNPFTPIDVIVTVMLFIVVDFGKYPLYIVNVEFWADAYNIKLLDESTPLDQLTDG